MEPIKVHFWNTYIFDHPKFTGCLIDAVNDIAWFKNGKCHREDGPAVELVNGSKYWYKHGKRHREDGPAIEHNNGSKWWWLNGQEYTEQEWLITMRKIKLEKVLKNIEG